MRQGKDLKQNVRYIDVVSKTVAWQEIQLESQGYEAYGVEQITFTSRRRVEGKGEDSGRSLAEEQKLEKVTGETGSRETGIKNKPKIQGNDSI